MKNLIKKITKIFKSDKIVCKCGNTASNKKTALGAAWTTSATGKFICPGCTSIYIKYLTGLQNG
ncbi:MAG: hypothetical protein EHM58_04490 [Ignavibacteriae bacterium]|nr:MAG: hypothetical protein EHM58_04490 [Ignavibacteriota bacterium]